MILFTWHVQAKGKGLCCSRKQILQLWVKLTHDIQKVFMDFLSNLFHFKAGSMACSLELDRGVPLYLKHCSDNTVLNELFFYVLSKAVNWQCMHTLTVHSMEDFQALAEATYVSRNLFQVWARASNSPVHLQDLCGVLQGLAGPYILLQDG